MHGLLKSASDVYALDYFGIIIVMSMLEYALPLREPGSTLRLRWVSNFAISILSTIVTRLVLPLVGVGWASLCRERGWGLLNQFATTPWLSFVLTLLVLDLGGYAQHYLLHHVPWLWRVHRAHHTDHDCDFSTGARFHPLESIFTNAGALGIIGLVGAPPLAVFVAQLVSTTIGFIEHSNVRVPQSVDRLLRFVLVTPDMHRLHHSQEAGESLTNYGATFTWWDRALGTYRARAVRGPDAIIFGVEGFDDRKHQTLPWMLAQPFLNERQDAAAVAMPRATSASN